MGFLQICAGVVLLQLSKSAKDVPDTAVFKGDLDQVRTVAEQEEPESEPKADAIRGTAAIIRRLSMSRQKLEAEEARRVHEERLKDQLEPVSENERVEWDGLRRRKTVIVGPAQPLQRRKTLHPPLGMSHFPEGDEAQEEDHVRDDDGEEFNGGFMSSFRRRAATSLLSGQRRSQIPLSPDARSPMYPVALTEVTVPPYKSGELTPYSPRADGGMEMSHVYGLPPGLNLPQGPTTDSGRHLAPYPLQGSPASLAPTPPPHSARRQFSFQKVFQRRKSDARPEDSQAIRPASRSGIGSPSSNKGPTNKSGTEEERLGLVKGDSTHTLPPPDYDDAAGFRPDEKRQSTASFADHPPLSPPPMEEDELDDYERRRERRPDRSKPLPELRNLMSPPRRSDEDEHEGERRRTKDWNGRGGGGSGRGGPAFI